MFQCRAAASNQAMIWPVSAGCCPSSARRLRIRWRLSAMFSHDPPTGGVQRHDPVREQPADEIRGLVPGEVVQHQEHAKRRQLGQQGRPDH